MLHSATSTNSTTVRSPAKLRLARAALHAAYAVSEDLGTSLAERQFTSPRRHARPTRERSILELARSFEIDVVLRSPRWNHQHTRVAAWRWGHGPTVLLVHGWEGRGSQLGAFVEPLVAAGLSVVTFDAPGHGDSSGHRLYLTDHADVIAGVVAAIGPIHAVIAHSFGAAALLLARARGGVDPARTIMVAPNVLIADSVRRFAELAALDDSDRLALEQYLAERSGMSIDDLRLEALVGERDGGLLVLHDRGDREVPFEDGLRLSSLWPQAHLVATEGLGHRRILRDPDVIAAAVEFASHAIRPPASDLVREVDRWLATGIVV